MQAVTFNGAGVLSSSQEIYACEPPSQGLAPARITSTRTSMHVSWLPPVNDGGCDILGYAVFIDDGANGAFTEVNSPNDQSVRNKPGLHELVITSVFNT